jgi:hypothetical protein
VVIGEPGCFFACNSDTVYVFDPISDIWPDPRADQCDYPNV